LTTQRTGSTWLVDLLHQLDGCECHGELILPQPVETTPIVGATDYKRYIEKKREHVLGVRPFSVFSYLNGLFKRDGIIGFKLMYSQLKKYPEVLVYLVVKRIKIIHLIRENFLDMVISAKVAEMSGRSHDAAGGDKTRDTQVHLDADDTVARIKELEKNVNLMNKLLRTLHLPSTSITYDQLKNDPESYGRLAEFLSPGAHASMPQSKLVKRQRKTHRESIANYDEIENALTASGHARFL
jgi:LPS sulfotransferase NodH